MPERAILDFGQLIINFLISCGGSYSNGVSAKTFHNVFYCLGASQYLIKYNGPEIEWFVCYWKINPEDVEAVSEGVKPYDIVNGSVMYVADCGCKSRKGIMEIRRTLRRIGRGMQGVLWHDTRGKGFQYFPSQKGMEEQSWEAQATQVQANP